MANLVRVGEGITAAAPPIKAEELGQLRLAAKLVSDINGAAKSPLGLYSLCACDDQGADIIVKPFHREWNQLVLENRFVLIEASRGTTKTSFAIFFALWMIGKNPNIRIKWLGPDDRNAQKRLRTIRDYITGSKLYQATFPHIVLDKKSPNNIGSLTVVRDIKTPELTVEAKGVLSAGTGDRADLIILDDVCVLEGTEVITRRGLIPIEQVIPGDYVRNHIGRWSRVGETHCRTVPTVLQIRGAMVGGTVTVTPSHPVYSASQDRAAGSDIEPAEFVPAHELANTEYKHWLASPVCREPDEPLDLKALWADVKLPGNARGRHKGIERACPTEHPDFWWMVGLWIAEGHLECKPSGTGCGYHISFASHQKEEQIRSRLVDIANRLLNRKAHVYRVTAVSQARRTVFSDKEFYLFLKQFKPGAPNKECPWWIYDLPTPCLKQLLLGMWQGDGSPGARGTFRLSTTSRALAVQIRELLTRFGVTASLPRGAWNKLSKHALYDVHISRTFSAAILDEPREDGPTWTRIENDALLRPVRSVEELHGEFKVYNLTMDQGEESYQSPGLTSHNCSYRNTILNPALREQVKNKLQGDWLPTLDPRRGRVLGIFTPWHHDDANAELIRTTNWVYKKYAHGLPGDPYHSIFEELFPREKLMQLRKEEGDLHYARGRLCQALTKDTVAIMAEHLRVYSARELTVDKLNRAICVYAIDPSSGKDLAKAKLDFMGNCILLFVPRLDGDPWRELSPYEIFVPECFQVKLSTREQVELIRRMSKQWRPDWVVIEAEGMQNLHEWLWEEPWINPEQVTPITSGGLSKGQRLMQVTPLLEPPEECPPIVYFHPEVVNPTPAPFELALPGGPYEALRNLRHQALNFPTQHDDTLDSAVHGMRFIKQWVIPEVIGEITLIQEHMELEAKELILSRRKLDGLGPAVGPLRQPTTRWEKKAPPPATIPEGEYDPEYGWVGWAK